MTNQSDQFWKQVAEPLRRRQGLALPTPGQAQADVDAAGEIAIPAEDVSAIAERVVQACTADRWKTGDDGSPSSLVPAALRHQVGEFVFDGGKQRHPQEVSEFQSRAARTDVPPAIRIGLWGWFHMRRVAPLAAAALVLLAVFVGIRHFGSIDGASRAYGITDIPALLQRAQIIHLVGWRKPVGGPPVGTGEQLDRYPTECWIDMQHEQCRNTWFQFHRPSADRNGSLHRMETIINGSSYVQVDHDAAEARVYRLSDFQRKLLIREKWEKTLEWVYRSEDGLAGFAKTGAEVIDGTNYDVWEEHRKVLRSRNDIDREEKTQVWLSPSSGAIGRYRHWTKLHKHYTADKVVEGPWQLDTETRIEMAVQPPEDTLRLRVPDAYRVTDAGPYEQGEILGPILSGYGAVVGKMHLIFALPGGAIITAWSVEDAGRYSPKTLAQLEPSRSLPLLPVEIFYGLAPAIEQWGRRIVFEDTSIVYQGRHLALTRKDNRLYEWAIFVPSQPIDARSTLRRCAIYCGMDPQEHVWFFPTYYGHRYGDLYECTDLFLDDREFADVVQGAMADLSDGGVAPAHVTYADVVHLTDKIRASIDKQAILNSFVPKEER